MERKLAQKAVRWILNTTVDVDKIAGHLNITGRDKEKLRETAIKLRAERDKKWSRQQS